MRNILLHINRYSYQKKIALKKRGFLLWYFFEFLRRFSQVTFNLYLKLYKLFNLYPHPLDGNTEIVVSLTSFPKRINVVWGAIDSIFHQKEKPSKIYLYLSKEEFPEERKRLPKRLLKYEKLGLEICFRQHNLMPHTKYYYALQEHTDKCVITIDDDVYYQNDIIQNLWSLHLKNPNAVCANKTRIIKKNGRDGFAKYEEWESDSTNNENIQSRIALGVAGVLYPPLKFSRSNMFDMSEIKALSLKADDLWLKIHEVLNGIEVVGNDYCFNGLTLDESGIVTLQSTNVDLGYNDKQWIALCDHYKIDTSIF